MFLLMSLVIIKEEDKIKLFFYFSVANGMGIIMSKLVLVF